MKLTGWEFGVRMSKLRICSLFSGIGGFEVGLGNSLFEPIMFCENDPAAQAVLRCKFPDIDLCEDIKTLRSLPKCEVVTAGWPCQDLSQAGRTLGITGTRSGLVGEVFRLLDASVVKPKIIILENVAFSLYLQGGKAIHQVVEELEARGYRWAYRILDTREFGLPHRRRRIFIVASREVDPMSILFDEPDDIVTDVEAEPARIGFYWTEGNRGLGWTPEAVPPLKGGSGLSIPSPPAIWERHTGQFFLPGISDAERLQGFSSGWTEAATHVKPGNRGRWRLVGNAVSVPVARWIAERLMRTGPSATWALGIPFPQSTTRRPNAAWGGPRMQRGTAAFSSEGPIHPRRMAISQFAFHDAKPLSLRAASGFLSRLIDSTLAKDKNFVSQLIQYCENSM